MSAQKRHVSRATQPFDAQYRLVGPGDDAWQPLTVLDVSTRGVRFEAEALLERHDRVDVRFTVPESTDPLVVSSRVIWSRSQHGRGVVETGVEFEDLSPDQRAQLDNLVGFLSKYPPPPPH
jgi:hypothetical protein